MRETIVWILVALTLVLVGWFWVRPSLQPAQVKEAAQIKDLMSRQLEKSIGPPVGSLEPAPAAPQPTKYQKLKAELDDWGGIASKFSPAVVAILALIVRKGGKKKK
jgi:hypothetical protein